MFSPTIIAGLLLGLAQIPYSTAQPLDTPDSFIISFNATDYFPGNKGDLSPFDIDIRFTGYNSSTRSWLTSIDPASGETDEERAILLTEIAYAKPYNADDSDMADDVNDLLAIVAGNITSIQRRSDSLEKRSTFTVATAHAVKWATCAGVFSCVSGTTCAFGLNIGKAPRSECQSQGGQQCCISWSDYNVRFGFFSVTWTSCNSDVKAEGKTDASCEGYGSSSQGGDVCLSNRGTGCT